MPTTNNAIISPEGGEGDARPLLSLTGISKRFPGVTALDDVDLQLWPGRSMALVGENGAGKSTLIKVVSGALHPDEGQILLDGRAVSMRSPAEARRHGVSLVPQELSVAGDRSVAENIFMGHLPRRGPLVNRRRLRAEARTLLQRLGIQVEPGSALAAHTPATQQMVMIARGIALQGRLFILDEPTAALTDPEIERLFAVLRELKAAGAALLYVSHRLGELREIADDITVLRDGRVVDRVSAKDATEDGLVRAMVGRPVERFFDTRSAHQVEKRERLTVRGLTRTGVFEDVSFTLHGGEVVGLAGLMGAGRTEVARAVFGVDRVQAGQVQVDGKAVQIRSPRAAIAAGIALVPEERKSQALVLDFSISDNIVLPHLRELAKVAVLQERRLRSYSRRVAELVGIKAPSVTVPVRSLSGGNQQKVVLGRWLTNTPKIYILDEPTRGIDVGAKAEIYQQIGRLADQGAAVLVISSELPELLGICDRILVMRAGRLVGELEAGVASEESVLELAMGTGG
ncbi:MAG: ribose transport system ATP-binding protein [Actinomycetota bacterium]|jgi:ABC-type sugar transport system ATPase subunit|nr:ribose transport system ATP-binding protein [Actinomycetota bacterium]